MTIVMVVTAIGFFHIPFLIAFGLFAFCYHREPRRVLCGVLLALAGLFLGIAIVLEVFFLQSAWPDSAVTRAAFRVMYVVLPLLGFIPALAVLATLGAGISNLVRHGLHLRNTFSLFFSLAALAYMIVWPLAKQLSMNQFSSQLYMYITVIIAYTIFLKTILTLTSEINLRHRKGPKGLSYVVVLGRPLKRESLVEMVHGRVDKGIEIYRMNEGSKLVLSGGYEADGVVTCDAMAVYAKEQGVSEEDILIERNGSSTESMVLESYELLKADYEADAAPKFAVVSSAYHVLRALLLARKHKIACIGYGERTTLTISMNAFVREYMLYMKITKKKQLILLAVYTAVFWIGTSLLQQYSPGQVLEAGQIMATWLAG